MTEMSKVTSHEVDETVVRETSDYDIFKTLTGNREVNKTHVKELVRLFVENGNRTAEFPIIVDGDMNVIDGQHRLEALKQLGWPVGYRQLQSTGIDLVRAINAGNRRWTWEDVAVSYAQLGNKEYEWFYQFTKSYDLTYSMAMAFATNRIGGNKSSKFTSGEFVVEDKERAVTAAEWYQDITDFIGNNRTMGIGWFVISRSSAYDHSRMVRKLNEVPTIQVQATNSDAARLFEDIYNRGYSEDAKIRLF